MAEINNGLVEPKTTDRWEKYDPSKTYSKNEKYIVLRSADANGKEELWFHFVSEEDYKKHYRPIWRIRERLQRSGECKCHCKELWKCDGECHLCEHFNNKNKSLDTEYDIGNGDVVTLADLIPDEVEEEVDNDKSQEFVDSFIATLTDTQKRRLQYRLDNPKISYREIALKEGVNWTKIQKTFNQIIKKYNDFKNSVGVQN